MVLSESSLVAVLICLSLLPIAAALGRIQARHRHVTASLVALWVGFPIIVVSASFLYSEPVADPEQSVTHRPIAERSNGYVGSTACRSCHPRQHSTWHDSYHRSMTQVATPTAVIGDFDNVVLTEDNLKFRLSRRGDEFWADMDVPTRRGFGNQVVRLESPIVMTTGSHHMQAYWFALQENSRLLGMFPFIYLKEAERWIPRQSAFLTPHGRTQIDEAGRWNDTCIDCHTTYGRKSVQGPNQAGSTTYDSVDSRVAEFGIACEACHGPGEEHVRANRNPTRRYAQHLNLGGDFDDPIVDPQQLDTVDHRRSTHVCGQCHGIHSVHNQDQLAESIETGFAFRPGDDLTESEMRFLIHCGYDPNPPMLQSKIERNPDFLRSMFWSDGMVRVSGREYNGLFKTPCYEHGTMSCLSCHQMHQADDDPRPVKEWADDQLKAGMRGNRACTQCHQEFDNSQTLTRHTHHAAGSSGSNCYNCHMPYTTYGLLKAIRSHTIDTPSVAASLETGRPNACNQCHLDRTLDWTGDQLSQWYGIDKPKLSEDEQKISASVLWLLKGDAGQRALMAWSYGWQSAQDASGTGWMAPYLAQLLEDPYDAIRYISYRSLRNLPRFEDFEYDFLGPPEANSLANEQVVELWRTQPGNQEGHGTAETLIGTDGALMREQFDQFLRQRNDRRVILLE